MTDTDDREMPYTGGTLDEFRARIHRHASTAEQRFNTLTDQMMTSHGQGTRPPLTEDEAAEHLLAHHACLYGWSTLSLIGFIRKHYGEDAAFRAASMVDDMGTNGDAPYTEDLLDLPNDGATEAASR
jgi:hypothetical protein